jgi:4-amino-4-deoxy-L-arabinose transferase-like glycosyltransferase
MVKSSFDYLILAIFIFFIVSFVALIWLLIAHPFIFLGLIVVAVIFWYIALHTSSIEVDPTDENF